MAGISQLPVKIAFQVMFKLFYCSVFRSDDILLNENVI